MNTLYNHTVPINDAPRLSATLHIRTGGLNGSGLIVNYQKVDAVFLIQPEILTPLVHLRPFYSEQYSTALHR